MIKLYEKKKELMEAGGETYKYNFFDLVFEKLKKERYQDIFNKD